MLTCVDVPEEDVTEDPEALRVISNNTAHTVRRTGRDLSKVERVCRNGKRLASEGDANIAGDGVARYGEEALADSVTRILRPGDRSVDRPDVRGVANEESRTSVNDGVNGTGEDGLSTDFGALDRDLPESRGGYEVRERETACELARIGAAEEELSASVEEGEAELRRGRLALGDERLEDGRCVEVRDRLEGHAHETIGRRLREREARRVD